MRACVRVKEDVEDVGCAVVRGKVTNLRDYSHNRILSYW